MNARGQARGWIVLAAVAIVAGALLITGIRYATNRTLLAELPPLPELARYSPAIQAQLSQADAEARAHPGSGEAVGALAMAYHANAFLEPARIAYRLAMKVAPKEPRWPHLLGVLEVKNGQNERAITFLSQAVELDPGDAHSWARLGQLYFRAGSIEEAEHAFRKALETDPTHPHAAVGMARVHGDGGQWVEAARVLEGAVAAHPNYGPAHRMLALAYGALGREDDARRHEELGSDIGLAMLDPLVHNLYMLSSTGDILVTEAQIAQSWGDTVRAERLLRRAVEVAPRERDVRMAMGRFLLRPGPGGRDPARVREARDNLAIALEIDPTYANIRHEYAMTLEALGDTTAAVVEWERILREEPMHAMACMSLGQVHLFRGNYEKARAFFRRGVDVPADTPFMLGQRGMGFDRLALASARAGDLDGAFAAYREGVDVDSRCTQLYVDWASLLREHDRPEEGIAVYREGVTANPNDATLRLSFGNYLLQLKRFAAAREQLEMATRLEPRDARALTALGFVLLELGSVEDAIARLQMSLQRQPDWYLTHFHLGNAYLRAGRRADAVREYETAARLQPGFGPARTALQQLGAGAGSR